METPNAPANISFRTSHIFRAPLANIIGLVNVIQAGGCTDPENEELVELIYVSAKQLDKMMEDAALRANLAEKNYWCCEGNEPETANVVQPV